MFSKKNIGFLYIIKEANGTSGWYKVGKTVDLERRLREYNSSFPNDRMSFIFVSERIYNLNEAEKELIDYLSSIKRLHKSRNEWFRADRSGTPIYVMAIRKIKKIENKYFHGDIDD